MGKQGHGNIQEDDSGKCKYMKRISTCSETIQYYTGYVYVLKTIQHYISGVDYDPEGRRIDWKGTRYNVDG